MSIRVPEPSSESDILEVISNLSNNEVFTPPRMADAVLDLLPPQVWTDPTLRWLDPGAKTGVFPRQVTRRLMWGLRHVIPDEMERLRHILGEMVHAIAITETTAMLTRRSLYCSRNANSEKAAVRRDEPAGNVMFPKTDHSFDARGRCDECGASKSQFEQLGRDNHAYALIHRSGREALEKEKSMKFDVIVGNPPYQMDADGSNRTMPIYDIFVEEAKKLNPRYITFIVPSRWMSSGLGLGEFRKEMLNDDRVRVIVDYPNAEDVFPGVGKSIKGGVMFFLWDRDNRGLCEVTLRRGRAVVGPVSRQLNQHDIFVRDATALPILDRVRAKGEQSITEILSADKEFGMTSNFDGWKATKSTTSVALYLNNGGKRLQRWLKRSDVGKSEHLIDTWKVLVPQAGSDGGQKLPDVVLGTAFVVAPPSVCTQTYLFFHCRSEEEARSIHSYLRTRFFRFLVSLRKLTQHATRSTYTWVPQQTWDRVWTDEALFEKYGITNEEQRYINAMIKEMPE